MLTSPESEIDLLLQDTWLQVISLRHGPEFKSGEGRLLWERCVADVGRVRQALEDAGLDEQNRQSILYAQCALLDEVVKGRSSQDESCMQWHDFPLLEHFQGTLMTSDKLCNHMRDVLAEPSPNISVLTCFHRVMMLGFLGGYRSLNDPERTRLVEALNAQVPPFTYPQMHPILAEALPERGMTGFFSHWPKRQGFKGRAAAPQMAVNLDDLPEPSYRQPIVLVCGDLPQPWPHNSSVFTVNQGCWIRVAQAQDLYQLVKQLLWLRPQWGRQLSVLVSVCPQQHSDMASLTSRLTALRGQISQLRKETHHALPLLLNGVVGSSMMSELLWQAAISGEGVNVWRESQVPCSIASWVTTGGAMAMRQQVLMNSLMTWFYQHVKSAFINDNPDMPKVLPAAVLWGIAPSLQGWQSANVWSAWLSRRTALSHSAGWLPASTASVSSLLPDFILPLLPEGSGLSSRRRGWCLALGLTTAAAVLAVLYSGWN